MGRVRSGILTTREARIGFGWCANSYAYCDTYGHANSCAYCDSYGHANSYAYCDTYGHANSYANCDTMESHERLLPRTRSGGPEAKTIPEPPRFSVQHEN